MQRTARSPVVAWLLLAVAAGCGAASTPAASLPAGDPRAAEKEARGVVEEAYGSLRRGSAEGLLPLLAGDVVAVGPRADDVHLERGAAIVALRDGFDLLPSRNGKHKLKSRSLRVFSSPGGHAAWATDQLDIDGIPHAMIAVLANVDDFWVVTMVHVARTVPDKALGKRVAGAGQPAWAPLAPAVDPAARDVVALFEEGLTGPEAWLAQLGDRKDALVVGTAPRAVTKGAKAIRKRWQKKGKAAPPALTRQGELRAQVTADGTLAWIIADLDHVAAAEGSPVVPHRAIYVYEQTDDGWKLVCVHESVAHVAG
jgi:ketosteroid isomerase-like protein